MGLTEVEEKTLEALRRNGGNRRRTAEDLGITERTLYKRLKALRDAGKINSDGSLPYHPGAGREIDSVTTRLDGAGDVIGRTVRESVAGEDEDFHRMEGRVIKTTTAISAKGIERQWIRHVPEDGSDAVNARMGEIIAQIKPAKPVKPVDAPRSASLCNNYVLTDAHIGMLAWGQETGAPWDLSIAKNLLKSAFGAMIASAPKSESAIIAILGDWMHYDGLLAITPTSGNILDADGRHGKMVDVAIEVVCWIVETALAHHEKVTLLIAEGNHDLAGSVWLRKVFAKLYEKSEHLTVVDRPFPYYALKFGNVFLGFHHGHLKGVKNPAELISVFAHEFGEMWGQTDKRYIHTGDKHFVYEDGSRGTVIRQHPTLASRDAWAARNGFINVRQAIATTYHDAYGETGSIRVSPEMLA